MSQPPRWLHQVRQVASLMHPSYNTRGQASQSRPLFRDFDRRSSDKDSSGLIWVTRRPDTP
jgi:hypothetical protein